MYTLDFIKAKQIQKQKQKKAIKNKIEQNRIYKEKYTTQHKCGKKK